MEVTERLPEEIAKQSITLHDQAISIKVIDQNTFKTAGEFGKSLKELEKKIVDFFRPLKESAFAAHKAITKKEAEELAPVKDAMDALRLTMNAFLRQQEALRIAEENKARLAAQEAARKEEERLLALAAKAEEKGKVEKAEELLERAENVYVAPVTVAPKVETAKFEGGNVGQVKEVQITVTDIKAFMAEIVKRGMAPTMFEVKTSPLKSWQKSNDIKNFPGLHIVETVSARIR